MLGLREGVRPVFLVEPLGAQAGARLDGGKEQAEGKRRIRGELLRERVPGV